ncbi:hypothetical protein Kpol_1025p3 [Vanderwaltozyma polyspora DSM 70294]|uniref:glutathione-specific gamma-glutamylcyclotransferase n=1 Tax=Vanderwaltozyma polyspora (strain ATCC 22028 / DSM 70294 / BCRC 21397 / CBS 2163 / NBRC 10782 / NRRL Y-8283 / UCD 57-17) TaxID=436907 RepID=A7TKS9_VANPO|nr:uncharacterized protein Kpol_1025p3 [Vanderwaltozyma polyspora DSM 70294]EDO17084.1 hypothetical protein Kpol_1025p3 [Vanderwaltozyma polyspora DSM 70294]
MTVEQKNGAWILGYGSLIYKPPPHYQYRIPAVIHGYIRRFWQSSIDHRGTPDYPGRVVTLVPYDEIISTPAYLNDVKYYNNSTSSDLLKLSDCSTLGVVYYISPEFVDKVKTYLDVREQNGYTLHKVKVHLEPNASQHNIDDLNHLLDELPSDTLTGKKILETSVYIGTSDNEAFVGAENIKDTAKVIATSIGPSGLNYEYLKLLHDSLLIIQENRSDDAISDNYLVELLKNVNSIKDS